MRIIHIVRSPVTIKAFLMPFLNAQADQGHDVSIACNSGEDTSAIDTSNIKAHTYPFEKKFSAKNFCAAIKKLRSIIEEGNFDLVIVHMPLAAAVTRIAGKLSKNKPKIIYVIHGLPCAPQQNKLKWLSWFTIEWLLGKLTDAIFVMNDYDYNLVRKTHFLRRPGNVYKIAGMGVDISKFSPGSNDNFYADQVGIVNKKIVLFTARMIREKGVFEVLEAAKLLIDKNYSFVLIGDGPASDEISKFIIDHQLNNNVFFLGWRDNISEFMKRCDLFVLPTYYSEGLPVTILEAMACGKAVITCKQRGCDEEIVENVTGYFVKPRNSEQLAEKIDLLLSNDILRSKMGKAGRKRVEQLFSLKKAIETFCSTISTIVNAWKPVK